MRALVIVSVLLTGLAACSTGPDVPESAAVYCVNRSDLRDSDTSQLARICGASNVTNVAPASSLDPAGQAAASNDFVRNEDMYRAGNSAMIAMAMAR